MFEYDELSAIEFMQSKKLPYLKTGSRIICDPPVMDTDIDIVVLDTGGVYFDKYGFENTNMSDEYDETDFDTYRQGEVNLIVVHTVEEFRAWKTAAESAKAMNLTNKDDRIAHFQGVLYGNW